MTTVLLFVLVMSVPVLMAYTAASDLLTMTIPNVISLALLAAFPVAAIMTGMPLVQFGLHLGLGMLVLVVTFGFFAMGWIGGGDAKFAAAAAVWFGPAHGLEFLVYTSFYGGLLTFGILGFRGLDLPLAVANTGWIQRLHDRHSGVPYGIAIAAGGLVVFPETPWFDAIAALYLS